MRRMRTHSTMPRARCAPPPQVNRADHGHLTLHMPLLGTRNLPHVCQLDALLGHAPWESLSGSRHSPFCLHATCRLAAHAPEFACKRADDPKFACKSRRVTCQLSSGDHRHALGRLLLVDCLLGAVRRAGTRTASSSHSMHVRAIHTHKAASAECSQQMRFPCFRAYCCMHVACIHSLCLLGIWRVTCRVVLHATATIRAHPLTHCFRSHWHAISRDMLATRLSVVCVLRNLCAPSSQCGGREPLPSVACSAKPNGLD